MISGERDHPYQYSYVGGMLNQAYLAGIAGEIEPKANPPRFKIYQNMNPNLALPVELKAGDYLPSMVKQGLPIKVEGHIFGKKLESGERVAIFRALKITQPTLLDMPGELAWLASTDGITPRKWPEGVPASPINPEFRDPSDAELTQMTAATGSANSETRFAGARGMPNLFSIAAGEEGKEGTLFRDRLKLRQAANAVKVAGIVEGAFMALDTNGRRQNDTLIVLLRQNTDSDRSIPIRVYSKLASSHHKLVKVGTPITILGQFRQRVKVVAKADVPGGVDQVVCYPYIHTSNIHVATPEQIKNVPEWAEALARKMSAARFSPHPPAGDGGNSGVDRAVTMDNEPSGNADLAMEADIKKFATVDPE